jgi:hypothetical protein
MAIYRLIANGTFLGRQKLKRWAAAYEAALVDLRLVDRDDPITEIVATAIIGITSRGERDPTMIKERALKTLDAGRFDADAA